MVSELPPLITKRLRERASSGMSEVGTRILRQPSGGENHCGTGDFEDSWVAVKNREGMMPPLKANEWRSPCGRKQKNGGDLDGQDKKGCKKRGEQADDAVDTINDSNMRIRKASKVSVYGIGCILVVKRKIKGNFVYEPSVVVKRDSEWCVVFGDGKTKTVEEIRKQHPKPKQMTVERVIAEFSSDENIWYLGALRKLTNLLKKHRLLYLPVDIVVWGTLFKRFKPKTDALLVGVRIFMAMAKKPSYQQRIGGRLDNGDGYNALFIELAQGPRPAEDDAVRGQYNVQFANLFDIKKRLRKAHAGKVDGDADLFESMFKYIVKHMNQLNLDELMGGPCVTILSFLEFLMDLLFPYLGSGYIVKQVIRSALNEIIPWERLCGEFPLGVYFIFLPDRENRTPKWMLCCNSKSFHELQLPFDIQYFSLYACLLNSLIDFMKGQSDVEQESLVMKLKKVVVEYIKLHGLNPSAAKFKPWAKWLSVDLRNRDPSEEQIHRKLRDDMKDKSKVKAVSLKKNKKRRKI